MALIHFKIQVRDRAHLARVIRTLRRVKQVQQIVRPRGGATAHARACSRRGVAHLEDLERFDVRPASSASRCRLRAPSTVRRAIGEIQLTLPCAGSTSSMPTIVISVLLAAVFVE